MMTGAVTLRSFAYMVEDMAMCVLALSDSATEKVAALGWAIILFGGFYLFWRFIVIPYIRIERIRKLMECSWDEARGIADYLDEIEVEWLKFYGWTNAAMNAFMPMVLWGNDRGNDRLIATWDESREGVRKLALERRLNPKWTDDDAVGAIALEIIKKRQKEGKGIFVPS